MDRLVHKEPSLERMPLLKHRDSIHIHQLRRLGINKNTFEEKEWKELYKLSEDTFVKESDSLKIDGAGAGLTDND